MGASRSVHSRAVSDCAVVDVDGCGYVNFQSGQMTAGAAGRARPGHAPGGR